MQQKISLENGVKDTTPVPMSRITPRSVASALSSIPKSPEGVLHTTKWKLADIGRNIVLSSLP